MLVEIEGLDAAGKTTQCGLLEGWMQISSIQALVVKEPSGTRFGYGLRELMASDISRDAKTEMFTFLAAKTQLYSEVIVPNLMAGKQVIAHRGSLSFLSYHHITAGISLDTLRELMAIATQGVTPDLTFLLDLPVDVAIERINGRKEATRFDLKGAEFFEKQRMLFKKLSEGGLKCHVLDGRLSKEKIHQEIKHQVSQLF